MTQSGEWSPDDSQGTETFEQTDEASDELSRLNPNFAEEVEGDPSLNPALLVDGRELEELGAQLDDPETLAAVDGDDDISDPPTVSKQTDDGDQEGWDLNEPLTKRDGPDEESNA
jgi:hypothetical protein